MPRLPREYSDSKVYHIIIKGIDDGDIFYDNEDKLVFKEKLKLTKEKFKYRIYACCLMNNHVHLVIDATNDILSKAMQGLSVRYVHYFNQKYNRKGPLIQERFKSKKVEDSRYFLEVCRYVHRNPEKAQIAKTNKYSWSSYNEYLYDEKLITKKILLHYFSNNLERFIKYTNKEESIDELMNNVEFEMNSKLCDEELINIIIKKYNLNSTKEIIPFFKDKKNRELLIELKNIYKIKKTQLSRITRVSPKIIDMIWNK